MNLAMRAVLCGLLIAPRAAAAQTPLERLVADLLPRVEALSGLEAKAPFAIAPLTREALRAALVADITDRQAEDLPLAERAYRLLGLLPDTFRLADALPGLAAEGIAGYYDAEVDTLYILDDLDLPVVRPVIAHEMTHALQDQHFDLGALLRATTDNDRSMALRAAAEGHATLVMLLVSLEDLTGEPVPFSELPDLQRLPLEALMPGRPTPEFAAAPRVLRESGAFPYGRGLGFVHALRSRDPDGVPFGPNLPISTEQVIDPARFFDATDPPATLAFDSVGDDWTTLYENSLGQFELSVLLMERHRLQSESLAGGWDGDRYRVLARAGVHALDWYIVWEDRSAANRFVTAYTQILRTRMGVSGDVQLLDLHGRAVTRVIETEAGIRPAVLPPPGLRIR